MLLLAKNNFLEVQLKVENFKKKMFGIESETTHRKLRERKEKQEKSLSNNGSNIRTSALPKQPTAQDASIDTQATNRYFDDIQQDQAMTTEAEVTEEIDLSQRNRNSICRQSQVLDSTRSKLMGLVNSTKGMRTELDSSYIDIVQLNSSQGLESQLTSTQVINSGDFVCEARFSSSSSASCEVPYQDSQVAISRDNPQNVQEELVLVESHNATNAPSKSASKGREKQLKKPFKSDIQQANHGSEIQLTWAVRERVSKYLALARRSFDFSSLVKTRRLVPGKTLTICINSQRYTALLQLDGTLETDADIRFPGLAQWIKSIMGRPFTRLTVKEQRSIQILYEDVPVEEILDRDGFEWDRESYEALGVTIDHQNSPKDTQRETLNSVDKPHETLPNSDKEILHLVPDEMNRNVKSLIVHTKAEYFPTCCCYEKSWEGKEPFPQHYLDELENW